MRTLFKNAYVLIRGEKEYETLTNAYVGVCDDYIGYVGVTLPKQKYDVEIDATNKLIMPGLINTHTHLGMSLLRGVASGKPLEEWLFKYILPIDDILTVKETYSGSLLSCMEMIRSGTTTCSDMYFIPMGTIQAVAESGIRCHINYCGNCSPDQLDFSKVKRFPDSIDFMNLLHEKGNEKDNLKSFNLDSLSNEVRLAIKEKRLVGEFSIHSVYMSTREYIEKTAQINQQYKTSLSAHACETKQEVENCIKATGMTPIKYFDSCKFFDNNNVYLAHCVHVSDEELSILKNKNVTIVHNPSSNLKLGSGIAPIAKAINMGINVSLGTDSCASNNNLDMFEEMHVAALLATGINQDPTAISVTNIIDMATINGAKALGRDDIGQIKEGKKADLIMLDLGHPHAYPRVDIPALIVYALSSSDVLLTMCNGKILYQDNKYLTLDKNKVKKLVDESLERINIKTL